MNIAILIVGVVLIVLGYFSLKKSRHLAKNGVKVMAKIVSVEKIRGQDEDGYTKYSYRPMLTFTDKKGINRQFKSDVSNSNKNKYYVGDEMEILYDPKNPEKAGVKSFGSMWLMPILLIIVGIMIIVGGVVGKF